VTGLEALTPAVLAGDVDSSVHGYDSVLLLAVDYRLTSHMLCRMQSFFLHQTDNKLTFTLVCAENHVKIITRNQSYIVDVSGKEYLVRTPANIRD